MRLILEIEASDDIQYIEKILAQLKPYLSKVEYPQPITPAPKLKLTEDPLAFQQRIRGEWS